MSSRMIRSIENFISAVRKDSEAWPPEQPRWFRGEPVSKKALVPTLYRDGFDSHENALLQMFRARAPGFHDQVPDRGNTDQWLFLARHVGLPTRLLDWSESALIGLYFALNEKGKDAVVWMLNPLHLNHFADGAPASQDPNELREFPLPWHRPEPPNRNFANENLRGAWELDGPGVKLPVAVYPTYVHPRLRGQRGCFTIHGKKKEGLSKLVPDSILKCYSLDPKFRRSMLTDLKGLGITDSVAFPDLDGLAAELKSQFS